MRPACLTLVLALTACQSGAAPGTTCARDSECASPNVCRLGRCRAACVENRDCSAGSQCFLVGAGVGACQLEADRRCGAACPSGLSCLADQCLRACSGASDCPSDGVCAIGSGASVGVCTDPRVDDAGPIGGEAGPEDGGTDGGADANVPQCRAVRHACMAGGTTCAILDDHTVACWGNDIAHQTGAEPSGEMMGGSPYRSHPTRVLDLAGDAIQVESLSCSDLHACGVTLDGHVLCWGAATTDVRGDGSVVAAHHATPAMFDEPGLVPWGEAPAPPALRVAVGREHVCAMSVDRMVVRCWGRNHVGQLGTGSAHDVGEPAQSASALAAGLTLPFASIVVGDGVTCATDDAGHVACVGHSALGILGVDVPMGGNAIATAVDPHVPARGLSIGQEFMCALGVTGHAQCIGVNVRQQLGRNTVPDRDPTAMPADVAGTTTFDSLWSGSIASATFALTGGAAYAWGDNFRGTAALDPTIQIRATPQRVASLTGIAEITVDAGSGCAVSSAGVLSCWGANDLAQLGRGAPGGDDATPTAVCIDLP